MDENTIPQAETVALLDDDFTDVPFSKRLSTEGVGQQQAIVSCMEPTGAKIIGMAK